VRAGFCWLCFAGCRSTEARKESAYPFAAFAPDPAPVTLTNQLNPELLRMTDDLFILGPGDAVEIEILGTPTSRAVAPVGPDGKIYFSLLPGLEV